MSSCTEHTISCPRCGARGIFTAWDSVNVDITPRLKEKVISGELFRWVCPGCGSLITVPYPMLYHDMERQIMVYHLLRRKLGGNELFMMKMMGNRGLMSKYIMRSAYGIEDFREKIVQLDSGLDDRAIEVLKYNLLHRDALKEIPKGAELRFAGKEENSETGESVLRFYIVHLDFRDQPFLDVPDDAYNEIVNAGKLNSLFGNKETDYLEVSQEYISKVLKITE